MELEKLLQTIGNETGTEKTASAPKPDVARTALADVLEKAASADAPTQDPVDDLMKMAGQMAEDEKQAELIHAQACGRNFANAAIESWSAADAKIAQANVGGATKVASMEKLSEADALVLGEVASRSYQETMTKVAEAEYNQGQNDALAEIQEATATEFYKGAKEVEVLIQLSQE
jgi:hypothetical protein